MHYIVKEKYEKDVRFQFVVTYNTTKLSFYANTKDCIDKLAHSYIVYKFRYPGCSSNYIGKTEGTIFERINEHVFKVRIVWYTTILITVMEQSI